MFNLIGVSVTELLPLADISWSLFCVIKALRKTQPLSELSRKPICKALKHREDD